MVVHADTLRGHGNQPTVEEGPYAIPLEHTGSSDFKETLTFSIDSVRATSAVLRLDWGHERMRMKLEHRPGGAPRADARGGSVVDRGVEVRRHGRSSVP